MTPGHTTEAVIHALRTGVNGIPDLPVEADAVKQPSEDVTDSASEMASRVAAPMQTSWVSLIAVAAVAIGVIGACVGLTQSRRRRRLSFPLSAVPDPHALTPPHGDKLLPRH
jgi:hypothetical protein